MASPKYTPLYSNDQLRQESSGQVSFLGTRISSRVCILVPWTLALFFATLALVLSLNPFLVSNPLGTYEAGFSSDFLFPSGVPIEKVRFTGSPQSFETESNTLGPDDKTLLYFGPPSLEIDQNWERYIGERYFSLTEEEAVRAWGVKRHEYVDEALGGYSAGFDMLHTLHCLNQIRKALYPKNYHPQLSNIVHLNHCLDQVRQSIECCGSTTLVPTKFFEVLQYNYADSNQLHMCRSFDFIRNFTTSRAPSHSSYASRDEKLIDPRKHALYESRLSSLKAQATHKPQGYDNSHTLGSFSEGDSRVGGG